MEEARGRGSEEQDRSGGVRMGGEVLKAHFQISNLLDLLQEKKFGGLIREEDNQDL